MALIGEEEAEVWNFIDSDSENGDDDLSNQGYITS